MAKVSRECDEPIWEDKLEESLVCQFPSQERC